MKASHIFSLLISILTLFGCQSYERKPDCHLDKMHIKGNVVKIETIVQSTMPLTEMYAKAFDPQDAISTDAGNIVIEIDNNGNIKHSFGYGIDGGKIFDTGKFSPKNDFYASPSILTHPSIRAHRAKENIDNTKTITLENGDIVNVKYYDKDELVLDMKTFYNEDGSIKSIVKEYTNLLNRFTDTTTFSYIEYDNTGNWIEAEINYKGAFQSCTLSYKIKRQITYLEDNKKPVLIDELTTYNKANMTTTDDTVQVALGGYGTMSIPHYMTLQFNDYIRDIKDVIPPPLIGPTIDQMNYLLRNMYNNKDAYATISVNLTPGDDSDRYENLSPKELEYDEEIDKFIEEQFTASMAQEGTYILKWLPYKITTISGRRALKLTYYRFGRGLNPIPVYCEYYIIPMTDGNTMGIIFSFQSNLYNKFYKDFEQLINSIRF